MDVYLSIHTQVRVCVNSILQKLKLSIAVSSFTFSQSAYNREVKWIMIRFGLVLFHLNFCRLFNAKSILIHINSSISKNSVWHKNTGSMWKTVPFQTMCVYVCLCVGEYMCVRVCISAYVFVHYVCMWLCCILIYIFMQHHNNTIINRRRKTSLTKYLYLSLYL